MQKVKTFELKEIRELAKEYKFCCLHDVNGNSKINWNGYTSKMSEHFPKCLKRLESQALEDGFYYFCFANSVRLFNNPDKFLVVKGKPEKMEILKPTQEQEHHNNNHSQTRSDLITVDQALKYISEIAELKVKVQVAEAENKLLKEKIEVLEAEISEIESEEGLSEGQPSNTLEYLKEVGPTLMGMADKYFEQKDRALNLEELKLKYSLNGHSKTPNNTAKRTITKIETGSPEHIAYIKMLYEKNDEEKMNEELDKLEVFNPEQYNTLCTELNLNTETE